MGNLGDNYATLDELKKRLQLTDQSGLDDDMEAALEAASREIERQTHRQFNKTTTASPRTFEPHSMTRVYVDDFWTETDFGIAVDWNGDGVFEQVWSATDYELHPLNGIVEGIPGHPYTNIQASGRKWFRDWFYFPTMARRGIVQVTAQWGWADVPAPIKQACLIMASQDFQLKDAPFGVAGFGEFGAVRVHGTNAIAAGKLARYDRRPVQVG